MEGREKQANYALLKVKLKIALKNEFWFEACLIEYAIIEDRTASILAYAGTCKDPYSKQLTHKLNAIEQLIGKKHLVISKKVKTEELQLIRDWKEKRNDIVHNICRIKYENDDLKEIAWDGKTVMDKISNAAQRVAKAYKKGNTK